MGDILTAIIGSSSQSQQQTTPDAIAQEMNRVRLGQLQSFFDNPEGTGNISQFMGANYDGSYTPSDFSKELIQRARDEILNPSFKQDLSYSDYQNKGYAGNENAYNANLGNLSSAYGTNLANIAAAYSTALAGNEADRQRAIDLGTNAVGGYVDQIATPRLYQALALQGLESGGAVPVAIARATSEQAIPYLQSIEQSYAGAQGGLRQANLGQVGQAGTTYQGGVSNAGTTYQGALADFIRSLPGAQQILGMLPYQAQAAQLQNLNSAYGLSDTERQLRESDLLRRQGLATSIYTGIPFSPGSTTRQAGSTGNIFDQISAMGKSYWAGSGEKGVGTGALFS